jgi:hypothetical protein
MNMQKLNVFKKTDKNVALPPPSLHQSRSRGGVNDAKSKEKLQETIALLVDRQNDAQFGENKKNVLRNLGISSDAPFSICEDATLEKLKTLLDSCNSAKVQAVYAEALRSALSGPGHEGVGVERRRSVSGENRKVLFKNPTGQLILRSLIDDFWAHNTKQDFCDHALQYISDDILDLVGEWVAPRRYLI